MSVTFAAKSRRLSSSSGFSASAVPDHDLDLQQAEDEEKEIQPLLPGLPDHLAQLCLSGLPPSLLFSVCHSWRRLLYSPTFPPFLSLYAVLSPAADDGDGDDEDPVSFYAYDPISAKWDPLPSSPPHPPMRQLLLRHPSFISRSLPVQSVAAAGHLVVLAATTHRLLPALPRPLVFQPSSGRWRLGPPLSAPRRWCVAGAVGGNVYVASGVGADYNADVARSVERWDPTEANFSGGWDRAAPLRNGRFSREAVEAVASGGKLCTVSVRGRAAKEGAVYDVVSDRWEEMPEGMLAGWRGPAASAVESGPIYVVDEVSGVLSSYDWNSDSWKTVVESERLKGAEQMAAGGGKVCVVTDGGAGVVVVDVAVARSGRRIWEMELPERKRVLAVHVLPRMSRG